MAVDWADGAGWWSEPSHGSISSGDCACATKNGRTFTGIPVLGVCFDMLALPASRLGGGLKLALPAMHWRRADQQLSLGYRRIGSNTSTSSGNRCIVPTHGKWEPVVAGVLELGLAGLLAWPLL